MKYKAYDGLDYIRDQEWKPMEKTIKGWQRYVDRIAKNRQPAGFWYGVVSKMDSKLNTVMISIGGQPE
jgi:hypothetical protein